MLVLSHVSVMLDLVKALEGFFDFKLLKEFLVAITIYKPIASYLIFTFAILKNALIVTDYKKYF